MLMAFWAQVRPACVNLAPVIVNLVISATEKLEDWLQAARLDKRRRNLMVTPSKKIVKGVDEYGALVNTGNWRHPLPA